MATDSGRGRPPASRGRIAFYGSNKPFGEFSNFYPAPITVGGVHWPTSEHYFQGMKFIHIPAHCEAIRAANTPGHCKTLGCSRAYPIRSDWEEVKDAVMATALHAKFTQHSKLRDLILSTGDAELVEQTHNDRIWGDGGDGSGENRLGKLLMELRQQLREAGDGVPPPPVLPLPPGFDEENQPLKRSKSQYAGDDEGEGRKRSDDGEDATPAAPPAAAAADSGSKLNIRTGDLLQATEQYIAHQCNCVSRGARGLAKTLFAKYPHANVYQSRKSPSQPGTILVHGPPGRQIISMFAQYGPGDAKGRDSKEQRFTWFKECLSAIAKLPKLTSIAFPYQIGCGLAGGDWAQYRRALEEFAERVAPARIVIYQRPEDAPKTATAAAKSVASAASKPASSLGNTPSIATFFRK